MKEKLNVLMFDGTFSIDPEQLKSTQLCNAPFMNTEKNIISGRATLSSTKQAATLGALVPFSSKVRKGALFPSDPIP